MENNRRLFVDKRGSFRDGTTETRVPGPNIPEIPSLGTTSRSWYKRKATGHSGMKWLIS